MSIAMSKYVDITSGVGGEASVSRKALIARIFTQNKLLPTGSVLEFSTLFDVENYFGATSDEYKFANKYFSFISKNITKANLISFARFSLVDTNPMLISTKKLDAISNWTGITNGAFKLSMGGIIYQITGLDFSSITSYGDIASIIQAGIRVNTAGGELWTTATVEYMDGSFILIGGEAGNIIVTATESPSVGTNISNLVGWDIATKPLISNGITAQTITQALNNTTDKTNNFGSFSFLDTLTITQLKEAEEWCNAQNNQFIYSILVNDTNYQEIQVALNGLNGVCLTYSIYEDMANFMPMVLLATTDYDRVNSVIDYEFQTFPSETPSVTETILSNELDALSINYLGATQQAGKLIAFYQMGTLQGEVKDIGAYANEMWLKDAMLTNWMNLFLAVNSVPANISGELQALGVVQEIFEKAKTNGTFSIGKELNSVQKAFILQNTNDENAWLQIQNQGYWINVEIIDKTINQKIVKVLKYLLLYSKNDTIKKIEGSNVMI